MILSTPTAISPTPPTMSPAAFPQVVRAENSRNSVISERPLAAGVFNYEQSGDQSFPMIALRADRPLSKWARLEASTTYTRPEVQTNTGGMFDPDLPARN